MSGRKGMLHYSRKMKNQTRKEYDGGTSINELSRRFGIGRYAKASTVAPRSDAVAAVSHVSRA